MRFGMTIEMCATLCVVLLGAPSAALAQTDVVIGGGTVWQWPGYGPYASDPYGGFAPWVPQIRRDIRREMRSQDLRRELELRDGGGSPLGTGGLYGAPRYSPPPTPESQVQPRYRGSGDVRPEYQTR